MNFIEPLLTARSRGTFGVFVEFFNIISHIVNKFIFNCLQTVLIYLV